MTTAFLALGANIGNREANMRMALRWLGRSCRVVSVSSLYRSDAVVVEGAQPGPDYLNAVCEIETELTPDELLRFVKEIEYEMGRRPAARWAARIIDIDVALYGDVVMATAQLTVPHAAMAERNFVLVPLAELAAGVMHPVAKRTIGELAEDVDLDGLEHLFGPEWVDGSTTPDEAADEEPDAEGE